MNLPSFSSYEVDYLCGRITMRAFWYFSCGKVVGKVVKGVDKIAVKHKIDSTDPSVVSENLFKCLDSID